MNENDESRDSFGSPGFGSPDYKKYTNVKVQSVSAGMAEHLDNPTFRVEIRDYGTFGMGVPLDKPIALPMLQILTLGKAVDIAVDETDVPPTIKWVKVAYA
ncbi:hypothetical protein [Paraburkholderia terricola]|uniref:hypothetical protein n=1 Tax=Paraburkholderia terricola TaxID=169427 RepID=UPI003ECC8EC2